jgi:prepilin-type N-terminal cleavage/methylation domain-containing protein
MKNQKGFYLIELVVSLAIIAIVVLAANNALVQSTKLQSRATNYQSLVEEQTLLSVQLKQVDEFEKKIEIAKKRPTNNQTFCWAAPAFENCNLPNSDRQTIKNQCKSGNEESCKIDKALDYPIQTQVSYKLKDSNIKNSDQKIQSYELKVSSSIKGIERVSFFNIEKLSKPLVTSNSEQNTDDTLTNGDVVYSGANCPSGMILSTDTSGKAQCVQLSLSCANGAGLKELNFTNTANLCNGSNQTFANVSSANRLTDYEPNRRPNRVDCKEPPCDPPPACPNPPCTTPVTPIEIPRGNPDLYNPLCDKRGDTGVISEPHQQFTDTELDGQKGDRFRSDKITAERVCKKFLPNATYAEYGSTRFHSCRDNSLTQFREDGKWDRRNACSAGNSGMNWVRCENSCCPKKFFPEPHNLPQFAAIVNNGHTAFAGDLQTAIKVCSLLMPEADYVSYSTARYKSPRDNTVAFWRSNNTWETVGARSHNSRISSLVCEKLCWPKRVLENPGNYDPVKLPSGVTYKANQETAKYLCSKLLPTSNFATYTVGNFHSCRDNAIVNIVNNIPQQNNACREGNEFIRTLVCEKTNCKKEEFENIGPLTGVNFSTNDYYEADDATAQRLCDIMKPRSRAAGFYTRKIESCSGQSQKWDGNNWIKQSNCVAGQSEKIQRLICSDCFSN